MRYLLAFLPIAVVLVLMAVWRWGAHKAGPGGLLAAVIVAAGAFGLNFEVLWVSQAKGFLLSIFVLAVMWPALFLFHWLNTGGGITSIAQALQRAIPDQGMCALLMAWALSGVLEGMAGFGIPVAIVSPMVVAIGIPPLRAVAAVAVGHCWAVTFGSMGIIFDTLSVITGLRGADIVGWSGLLLACACFLSGLGTAFILGQQKKWLWVVILSALMGGSQYFVAAAGLVPLSCFLAGIVGLGAYLFLRKSSRLFVGGNRSNNTTPKEYGGANRALWHSLACYGALAAIMGTLTLCSPLRKTAEKVFWKASFSNVVTNNGYATKAESGPSFRLLTHPGMLIALVAVAAVAFSLASSGPGTPERLGKTLAATWSSGAFTSLGIFSMVGISTLMEHCGMSLLLAQGISKVLGSAYPLASPMVGVLGAFATGSNNNSNIMFGPLQKNVAVLLNLSPALLVAAQTAGGSLGSLLAPAKLVVGCSTVGLIGQEGLVLRKTMPYGIGIGIILGVITLICARIF